MPLSDHAHRLELVANHEREAGNLLMAGVKGRHGLAGGILHSVVKGTPSGSEGSRLLVLFAQIGTDIESLLTKIRTLENDARDLADVLRSGGAPGTGGGGDGGA